MKVKTADLIGPALDWAVAKCEFEGCEDWDGTLDGVDCVSDLQGVAYAPSKNWSQGGPIVEREKIATDAEMGDVWRARMEYTNDDSLRPQWSEEDGPTFLVAAMRCFVASRFGDEVDVPDELV